MTYKMIVGSLVLSEVESWALKHIKDWRVGFLSECKLEQLTCDDETGCFFEVRVPVMILSVGTREYFVRGYVTDQGRVVITSVIYDYITSDPVKSPKHGFIYGPALNYFYFDIMGYSFPEDKEA